MTDNTWNGYSEDELRELTEISERYKNCLDGGKTERECASLVIREAERAGYRELGEYIKKGAQLRPGDRIYAVCMNKTVALFNIGRKPLTEGMNILGDHVDSPRLDIKQNPLYEAEGMAYFDTHYYGGIKKYQWVTQPLAIHGVVCKKDGTTVEVRVGEDRDDPVFVITDLLVHLSAKQMEKSASSVIDGEGLDVLIGNRPVSELGEKKEEAVKENVLALLGEKYGITAEDFASAELEVVPAGCARDLGFDRSMILAYGQDDRVCAFTSLFAMLETDAPERTACTLLVDKEEIGSVGATGMHSRFFENTLAEILSLCGEKDYIALKRALANSTMLSSDVSASYDPLYAEAFEKRSSAFISRGISFNKFTGSRGKSGSNDAGAEYLALIRKIMDDAGVRYQFSELGKVDVGGGGTIAYIMANYGMQVIDSGVAVLSMHAPYEVTSKADVYEAVKCYRAFLKNA